MSQPAGHFIIMLRVFSVHISIGKMFVASLPLFTINAIASYILLVYSQPEVTLTKQYNKKYHSLECAINTHGKIINAHPLSFLLL